MFSASASGRVLQDFLSQYCKEHFGHLYKLKRTSGVHPVIRDAIEIMEEVAAKGAAHMDLKQVQMLVAFPDIARTESAMKHFPSEWVQTLRHVRLHANTLKSELMREREAIITKTLLPHLQKLWNANVVMLTDVAYNKLGGYGAAFFSLEALYKALNGLAEKEAFFKKLAKRDSNPKYKIDPAKLGKLLERDRNLKLLSDMSGTLVAVVAELDKKRDADDIAKINEMRDDYVKHLQQPLKRLLILQPSQDIDF